MKAETKKGMIHENLHDRKEVVKILDVITHESGNADKIIVIYRKVIPIIKSSMPLNGFFLDFDLAFGTKKIYTSVGDFEEKYRWFVADAETEARIEKGFYDV